MNRLLTIYFSLLIFNLSAQESIELGVEETVRMAKTQSPEAKAAINRFRNAYWQYRVFKSEQLPAVSLNGTIPNFDRSINEITLPDGSQAFRERSLATSSLNLNVNQNIGLTGGSVFMRSELRRIDIFSDSNTTSYLGTPVSIGYRQPILGFNRLSWDQQIEPLRYREAKRAYLEELEEISRRAVNLYFDAYLAGINLKIAKLNKANNDTIYKIAKGRYNLGKIAENELLQMELSLLNAELNEEQAMLDVENSKFALKSFLGLPKNSQIGILDPVNPPELNPKLDKAIAEAYENRQGIISFKRRLTEAERDVVRAKRENGFSADLFATYGLTNSENTFGQIYENPQNQQQLSLGFQIPILNWGRNKAQREMAKANRDLVQTNISQARADFEQEVILGVQAFNMQKKQVRVAAKADTISQKRFRITKQRFLIGKLDITELNLALTERDRARRAYIQAIRTFWTNYYNIRRLTLYDFKQDRAIEVEEIDDLL